MGVIRCTASQSPSGIDNDQVEQLSHVHIFGGGMCMGELVR